MANLNTKIEWTDVTWSPVTGCTKVSQGCKHCYAERLWPKIEGARVKREGGEPRPFTQVRTHYARLDQPLRWRKPRRIFVNSMSDLFHEDVPGDFIEAIFHRMAMAPQHIFQILTKRAERMRNFLTGGRAFEKPLPNVWLGVSVEDQATANERIPLLLQTPAAVHFVSYEPAIESVNFSEPLNMWPAGVDWVIVGGESGPHARPSQLDWFRSARDQCKAAGVAFFMKQLGRCPLSTHDEGEPWLELIDDNGKPTGEWGFDGASRAGGDPSEWPADLRIREYPA